jgi:hypothetical protein
MRLLRPFILVAALMAVKLLVSSEVSPFYGYDRYDGYEPVFMEHDELKNSVKFIEGKREMSNPGKLWMAGTKIYVVERYKGVHIVDNTDPANPVQTGFIVVPGCMDVAVKDNIIYLDNATDLVAFDLDSKAVTERIEDYFPEPSAPNGDTYYGNRGSKVVVRWDKTGENR